MKYKDPSLLELAKNDIDLALYGFTFEAGDLDFYFLESNLKQIPALVLARLKRVKRNQGI